VTSSWFSLSTPNYDARSTTHQIHQKCFFFVTGLKGQEDYLPVDGNPQHTSARILKIMIKFLIRYS